MRAPSVSIALESRACESILTAQEKSILKNVTASATSFFDKEENCCISAKDGKCINGFIRIREVVPD